MSYQDERIEEFLIESRENLDGLDSDILLLEKDPGSQEAIDRIFRTIHTIKGTCGFFGFSKLEALTHAGEDLLSLMRDGKVICDGEVSGALLALADSIRGMLAAIESSRHEGDIDDSRVREEISRIQKEKRAELALRAREAARVEGDAVDAAGAAETTIRVDVGLLDRLMNLMGELVLARNRIIQLTAAQEDRALVASCQGLNLLTTELQGEVMKTRLQKIAHLWRKYPRTVRDLALFCGKQVRLELEGEETELDRSIIECLKDPLTHLLRNAIDHGIEPPELRTALGKTPEGRILLRAFHENGQVNIEILDDGAGIDTDRIWRTAIEKGVISSEKAARLTERELQGLIFLPGFSTADKVTSVSGRGVGMDVVKTSIETVGGTVDLESRPGIGTLFRVKIPLTLAIIRALIVTCGGSRYALPQANVLEVVRLEGADIRKRVERVHGAAVYRLRGNLIPLLYLDQELKEPGTRTPDEAFHILILRADEHPYGLIVDRVNDTEEIVVKPLGKRLRALSIYAGATIMGDGKVALILDAVNLARGAGVLSGANRRAAAERPPLAAESPGKRGRLLLFRAPGDRRLAIPLSTVARLELFRRSEIELVGDRAVVQSEGRLLPLIHVLDLLEGGSGTGLPSIGDAEPDAESLQVVLHAGDGRPVGLLVGRILDIEEEASEVRRGGIRPGILGVVLVGGRVTEVLDVEAVIRMSGTQPVEEPELAARSGAGHAQN